MQFKRGFRDERIDMPNAMQIESDLPCLPAPWKHQSGKPEDTKRQNLSRLIRRQKLGARFHDLTTKRCDCFCCAQLAQKIKKGAHMRPHHA